MSAIERQWIMLQALPRAPRRVSTATVQQHLCGHGLSVTRRTIQRDLVKLSRMLPLSCRSHEKPYGWAWAKDAALPWEVAA